MEEVGHGGRWGDRRWRTEDGRAKKKRRWEEVGGVGGGGTEVRDEEVGERRWERGGGGTEVRDEELGERRWGY